LRFIVERQNFNGPVSPAPWKQTYKSPRQTAQASSTTAAAFTAMGVNVSLPGDGRGWSDVYYRVTLKLFWYRADGSTQQAVTHKMKYYENWIDGEYASSSKGDYSCPGGNPYYPA
jgi:hypothetical protein